ncbi:hypothetical protein Vau01_116830 [Virgisporangium aurantiacum]|uniref:Uncharacterized protein n=1 Tax=Virgisporangium aurantiacum TaxID=175570 RepID=A0A8J4E9W8_9ACTN|nr:hypothetical protein Vau01_116830 [Virgisporangium aurantiacum]
MAGLMYWLPDFTPYLTFVNVTTTTVFEPRMFSVSVIGWPAVTTAGVLALAGSAVSPLLVLLPVEPAPQASAAATNGVATSATSARRMIRS